MASSLLLSNIVAGYGAVRVIDDVSLSVGEGETVALLGTNGNGKSTLMRCVMGLLAPTAGSIKLEIDGITHELAGARTEDIVGLGVVMVPEVGRTMPMIDFIRVDLPLPLVPSSATVSPAPTFSDTSSSTRTAA